jgi:hypothetical protein
VSAIKVDEVCTCACHAGSYRFHVRWKPCCEAPVDGGKIARVFEMDTREGMVPVIADDEAAANQVLRELGLL